VEEYYSQALAYYYYTVYILTYKEALTAQGPGAAAPFARPQGRGLCAICLAEFANGDTVRVMLACGHGFHARCIELWLAGGRRSSCPTCRAPAAVAAAAPPLVLPNVPRACRCCRCRAAARPAQRAAYRPLPRSLMRPRRHRRERLALASTGACCSCRCRCFTCKARHAVFLHDSLACSFVLSLNY
jgi:hypothetical protein